MKFFDEMESIKDLFDLEDLERAVDGNKLKFPMDGKFDEETSLKICKALNVEPISIEFHMWEERVVSRKKRIAGDLFFANDVYTNVCFTLSFDETKLLKKRK